MLTLSPVPGSGWFTLDSSSVFIEPKQWSLMFEADFDGEKVNLPTELSIDTQGWTFVGLSHIGGPLFVASLQQGEIHQSKAPVLPQVMQAETMLRDFQLAFLPTKLLLSQIKDSDVRLEENDSKRVLFWKGQPFIEIAYDNYAQPTGSVYFENKLQLYSWSTQELLESAPPIWSEEQ